MEAEGPTCAELACTTCNKRIHRIVDEDGDETYHCGLRCHGGFLKKREAMKYDGLLTRVTKLEKEKNDFKKRNRKYKKTVKELQERNEELMRLQERSSSGSEDGGDGMDSGDGAAAPHSPPHVTSDEEQSAEPSRMSPMGENYARMNDDPLQRPRAPRPPSPSSSTSSTPSERVKHRPADVNCSQ